ncbi:MAG: DUF2089 family protein [Oscillospiraceae bacterium]|nr:DUF2089 family protein [Oscillospiraceae bacterium]
MTKAISTCPACQGKLYIASLACPDCGMELKNTFDISSFDTLDNEKFAFLLSFLRNRGNLKNVQTELQISYPTAKRKLDEILIALDLFEEDAGFSEKEEMDMRNWFTDHTSTKASEIIKTKLKENGGRVIVHTVRGLPCEIYVAADGSSFESDKLPIKPAYRFEVFDTIVELLKKQNGRARKGNGRNYKLGEENCDDTTVVGYIAKHYAHKEDGASVFDPVFVLAAVLEWADIAKNERGELVLTANYRAKM